MRQSTRKGLMTMAAATGVIAAASGYAHADAGAAGSATGSPGVLSGNTVQAPVHVPVNVCGNTVNVVGLLDPAAGNACANHGGSGSGGHGGSHTSGRTHGSPGVGSGNTVQVPVDVPVNVCGNSVDVVGAGNAAQGNDCTNGSAHHGHHGHHGHHNPPGTPGHPCEPGHPGHPGEPGHPGTPRTPGHPGTPGTPGHPGKPATPPADSGRTPHGSTQVRAQGGDSARSVGGGQLAHTGSDVPLGLALPAGAGALLAGAVLYRKARASA
ncbi:chaplin family protein [Streptomyces sp. NPDC001037]|uniref:chaplin family protein n=1 Tax=Streptomyces sp. NPDC001037 TaxID=3364542 RepID=UPI0036BB261D